MTEFNFKITNKEDDDYIAMFAYHTTYAYFTTINWRLTLRIVDNFTENINLMAMYSKLILQWCLHWKSYIVAKHIECHNVSFHWNPYPFIHTFDSTFTGRVIGHNWLCEARHMKDIQIENTANYFLLFILIVSRYQFIYIVYSEKNSESLSVRT